MANRLMNVAAKSLMPDSAMSRAIERLPEIKTNVGNIERWASLLTGSYLMTRGFDSKGPGIASMLAGGCLLYRGIVGNCQLYQALGINTASTDRPQTVIPAGKGVKVEAAVTVNKSVHELYQEWRKLEQLPHFMQHLREVRPTSDYRSHWVAEGPLGMSVEWDAEITNDNMDEGIAWQSTEGSDIDTVGSVHFQPSKDGEGTEVRVNLKYDPPAGRLGAVIAKLFGNDPEAQIREDLERFKQLMETGETIETPRKKEK